MPNNNASQLADSTISQNGRVRIPKLFPESFFLLEDGLFSQTESQSFGVIDSNQFQTTSIVSFTGTKKIYALCMGTVFLQPQLNNIGKVNLVLKPFTQPVNGLDIKYIVYRGLEKSDFITSNGEIAGTETSGTEFVKYIWSQFNKFYNVEAGETAPTFLANFIGFPTTPTELSQQNETDLIDQYFYKISTILEDGTGEESSTAYELPIVPRGLQLGNALGEIGVDVILNTGNYIVNNDYSPFKLNLKYVREATHILDLNNEPDNFKKKLIKQCATDFLDIAAFYGLHGNDSGKLYIAGQNDPLIDKLAIYNLIENFYTKNNFYLYIRSNRQRYYNFYENYIFSDTNSNNLKIGTSIDDVVETTFGTDGWPILIINENQTSSTENNTISFQLITDNYKNASLYVKQGVLNSLHEENFVRQHNLLQETTENDLPSSDPTNYYTQLISLSTPSTNSLNIASFAEIIYEGSEFLIDEYIPPLNVDDEPVEPKTYLIKDIDDTFGLLNIMSAFSSGLEVELPTVIDEKLQIINFPSEGEIDGIAVIKYQKIEDRLKTADTPTFLERITYETLTHSIKRETSYHTKSSSGILDSISSGMKSNSEINEGFYQPKYPYSFDRKIFTHENESITGLSLFVLTGDYPTKKILGITNEEIQQLKDIITEHNLLNHKIYFDNRLTNNSLQLTSTENIQYNIYLLGIIAENTQGKLNCYFPEVDLKIYTIDGFVFTSSEYSKHIPHLPTNISHNIEIPQ